MGVPLAEGHIRDSAHIVPERDPSDIDEDQHRQRLWVRYKIVVSVLGLLEPFDSANSSGLFLEIDSM